MQKVWGFCSFKSTMITLSTHNPQWRGSGGGVSVTYGLRTTAEQLFQTDFETGDRSLLYLTPGIFEQKYRNCQCVKMGETKRVIGTSQISHSLSTL